MISLACFIMDEKSVRMSRFPPSSLAVSTRAFFWFCACKRFDFTTRDFADSMSQVTCGSADVSVSTP